MADENLIDSIDTDLQEESQQVNKIEQRIKNLSEKVKLTSEERDELARAKQSLEQEKQALSKEVEFFKNFNPLVTKYQEAANYQDKIREKVIAGYDVEDATISILAKEGKLTGFTPKAESPAGGSAPNAITGGVEKTISEMSREEMRAALIEAEKRGDISLG